METNSPKNSVWKALKGGSRKPDRDITVRRLSASRKLSALEKPLVVLHTKSVEYLAVDGRNADFTKTLIPAMVDRSWLVMAHSKEQVKLQGGKDISDFSWPVLYFSGAREKKLVPGNTFSG